MDDLDLPEQTSPKTSSTTKFCIAALGIVFGDIGTSPLYTLKTVIGLAGGTPAPETALGLLSLIIWTLLVTASLKYVSFVMRADNHGEGGILALISLLGARKAYRPFVMGIGLFGAALIYSDGAITPAISVLSAIEGLKIANPHLTEYVLPITVAILAVLFSVQFLGTARIGWVFGPIMTLWFIAIACMGMRGIADYPHVLFALNPWHALHYLMTGGWTGFLVLGGVFLCVTGAEALYADMGHIGAFPIRIVWYAVVLPSLILSYAGQTALLLTGVPQPENTFYALCPPSLLLPLIGLASLATIIASQSIITGAYSMTRQAILLGWCPPLHITQTSSLGYGQIYVWSVNWLLMIVTVGLAVAFGSSDNLAAAYGIAVSLTMLLTTILLFVTMREIWRWNLAISVSVAGVFVLTDAMFFAANLLKVLEGGWVPLVFAAGIFILFMTWHRGSWMVRKELASLTQPVADFTASLAVAGIPRVPGTAVFITHTKIDVPPILIWHVKHARALHRHVLVLYVTTASIPFVPAQQELEVQQLAPDLWRARVRAGFMDATDIPSLLKRNELPTDGFDLDDVTYYVGHETILRSEDKKMLPTWQETLFAFMRRNSDQPADFFRLPPDQVVELGWRIEM